MSGVTRRIYDSDIRDIQLMWSSQLNRIKSILPINYTKSTVIATLRRFFPHEWNSVEHKKEYYDAKDRFLKNRFGKKRFNMLHPIEMINKNKKFRLITSEDYIKNYSQNFNENNRKKEEELLRSERKLKIHKIDQKIKIAKMQTQSLELPFIEKLIGLYQRKTTSQKDKVYILFELKKYYNSNIISFFFKLNDTEINFQLRYMAFKHLQDFNYHPRLRKQRYIIVHTKNRKRKQFLKNEYAKQKYKILETPSELQDRIWNEKEQTLKKFDYFISHSSKDYEIIMKLKEYINNQNKLIYCDWINDSDYLKRELLSKITLNVIEHRINNSKEIVFVKSDYSLESPWCEYELNYAHDKGKKILFIDELDIKNDRFGFHEYLLENYYNPNYRDRIFYKE